MFFRTAIRVFNFKSPLCMDSRILAIQRCLYSQTLETKYSDVQKEKILEVLNQSDSAGLSGYEITKGRIKKISQWKNGNGQIKNLEDVELIEGFNEKTSVKLFDSILEGPSENVGNGVNKIKGQFLQPTLTDSVRKECDTVASIFITVNSVSWSLIDRRNYGLLKWEYHDIDYRDEKRLQITDILDLAWSITRKLPESDIYVMQAEATTLRAAGSDPNNPKVIAVNLQKAQMVAMIVALINSKCFLYSILDGPKDEVPEDKLPQKVYFLRPTLPYRLYGTLVGNEKVSTDQTVEMLLQEAKEISKNNTHVYVPEGLQNMFRTQKDLQKDMLGHSLLLGLTFMDLCIYKNQEKINSLMKKR